MKSSAKLLLLAILVGAACQEAEQAPRDPADVPAAETDAAWTTFFADRTLDGWVRQNGTASFELEDAALLGTTSEGSPNSFLCTEETYRDFELEFEVKVDPELNSGVQIRSRPKEAATGTSPDDQPGRIYGPQVEIAAAGEEGSGSGFIYGEAMGTGWLTPSDRLERHTHFRDEDWNQYRVIAQGPRIQTFLNGQPIEDLTHEEAYATHPEGAICLQVHGIQPGTGPYEVRWRNLRVREL